MLSGYAGSAKTDAEMKHHINSCSGCRAFTTQQSNLEHGISDAMNVEAAQGLASRIMLRKSTVVAQQDIRKRRFYAVAASIVLALSVFVGVEMQDNDVTIDRLVLNHIYDEEKHLHEKHTITHADTAKILAKLDINLKDSLGDVNYAGNCKMRNQLGAHMILAGAKGAVTILFMPEESLDKRIQIGDLRFSGVVVPAKTGSYAIVGEQGEAIEQFEQRMDEIIAYIS